MRAESEARDQAGRARGEGITSPRRRGDAAIGIIVGCLAAGLLWLVLWLCYILLFR